MVYSFPGSATLIFFLAHLTGHHGPDLLALVVVIGHKAKFLGKKVIHITDVGLILHYSTHQAGNKALSTKKTSDFSQGCHRVPFFFRA